MAPTTRPDEIEQLKTIVNELKAQLSERARDDPFEMDDLRSELAELRTQMAIRNSHGGDLFKLPDPFKFLSEFTGNKKELSAWLEEVNDLYNDFKVKTQNGGYSLSSLYIRAIKNKLNKSSHIIMC